MQPKDQHSFRVDLTGVNLSEDGRARLAGAIQGATLAALAELDTRGDQVAFAFLKDGRTQGIRIIERELVDQRLPELRTTLDEIGPG